MIKDLLRSNAARVQALPDRPSLDHLKNEAKSRHKLLRARNPSVQLATAQRDIARDYGFPSWRQLRAHVSMLSGASRPQTSADETARLKIEQAKPRREVKIDPSSLDRFTGSYELKPGSVFSVLREDDGLIVRLTTQKFFAVRPESDCKFFYNNPSLRAQLTFINDGSARASALILHQNGLEQTAKRIDEAQAARVEGALEERRRSNAPSAGNEAAVRRLIKETQTGAPNYDLMSEGLAKAFREQLVDNRRQLQSWGALISVTFVGVAQSDDSDVYDVRFSSCRTEWRLSVETSAKVRSANFREYP